jgi:hypothetical protein
MACLLGLWELVVVAALIAWQAVLVVRVRMAASPEEEVEVAGTLMMVLAEQVAAAVMAGLA